MRFTCLNGRSAFQFGESVLTPSEFAKRAKALGYSAIGFTDPVSIMVAPKLFDACRAEGIHGVLGFEINIQQSGNEACLALHRERRRLLLRLLPVEPPEKFAQDRRTERSDARSHPRPGPGDSHDR